MTNERWLKWAVARHFRQRGFRVSMKHVKVGNGAIDGEVLGGSWKLAMEVKSGHYYSKTECKLSYKAVAKRKRKPIEKAIAPRMKNAIIRLYRFAFPFTIARLVSTISARVATATSFMSTSFSALCLSMNLGEIRRLNSNGL